VKNISSDSVFKHRIIVRGKAKQGSIIAIEDVLNDAERHNEIN
jgi:hypothetical protein